jgi:hypothetical protein
VARPGDQAEHEQQGCGERQRRHPAPSRSTGAAGARHWVYLDLFAEDDSQRLFEDARAGELCRACRAAGRMSSNVGILARRVDQESATEITAVHG